VGVALVVGVEVVDEVVSLVVLFKDAVVGAFGVNLLRELQLLVLIIERSFFRIMEASSLSLIEHMSSRFIGIVLDSPKHVLVLLVVPLVMTITAHLISKQSWDLCITSTKIMLSGGVQLVSVYQIRRGSEVTVLLYDLYRIITA